MTKGKPLVEVFRTERNLPPTAFSNVLNKIGAPFNADWRSSPEWRIFVAGKREAARDAADQIAMLKDEIERLEEDQDDWELKY